MLGKAQEAGAGPLGLEEGTWYLGRDSGSGKHCGDLGPRQETNHQPGGLEEGPNPTLVASGRHSHP